MYAYYIWRKQLPFIQNISYTFIVQYTQCKQATYILHYTLQFPMSIMGSILQEDIMPHTCSRLVSKCYTYISNILLGFIIDFITNIRSSVPASFIQSLILHILVTIIYHIIQVKALSILVNISNIKCKVYCFYVFPTYLK